ncbi:voltage-gated K+ channel [Pontimonas salivibrio]|uniref:Voltage-gated K+ channel n=1 Tax=Pontimonas salivibrio TaxID=1159327 RepID=A0A2L2BSA1_9MICO|nr:potassium channel family protein [Pontimonas salivibrio]AVG24520.1 voltage-gated K+ channel [Pontimonas salivibrio]
MRAHAWERATEIPLLIAGFLFLFSYSWQVLADPSPEVYFAWELVAIVVWVFFGADYVVRLILARQRVRWFFRNILDFLVLVLPPLRPLRLVRLLVLVRVFRRNAPRLIRNRILAFASIATVLLVYIASLAVLEAERNVGAITTFGEALWWSLVTVTTVGYGDYTPVSFIGRAIAVGLMLGGVVLVGIIVGTLGSWIIQSVSEDNEEAIDETTDAVIALRDEVRQLRAALEDQGVDTEKRL